MKHLQFFIRQVHQLSDSEWDTAGGGGGGVFTGGTESLFFKTMIFEAG